jgi:uncharacterized repeat protein (TIGR01451 family)
VTFVSATDRVTPVNGVVTFVTPSLAAGASVSLSIVVTPTAPATVTDQARVTDNETDPTPADNRVALSTTVVSPTTPDLALLGNAPASVTLGNDVTYTFTVTDNGSAGATGVTLTDTLPSGVTFVSASGGVGPVNGALDFTIGSLAEGSSTSVTIVVTPRAAGTLENRARVAANESDPTPADNSIAQTTTVRAGPVVTRVHRFGFHAHPTTLVLTFDEPLDPARAQNTANYEIVALGGAHRRIRVKSAAYNPATRKVTLRPSHRLNLHDLFRLTVVGTGPSGVTDASGNPLDGQNTPGDQGNNFVTIVSAADLVLTTTDPAIIRAYRKIVSRQASHLEARP